MFYPYSRISNFPARSLWKHHTPTLSFLFSGYSELTNDNLNVKKQIYLRSAAGVQLTIGTESKFQTWRRNRCYSHATMPKRGLGRKELQSHSRTCENCREVLKARQEEFHTPSFYFLENLWPVLVRFFRKHHRVAQESQNGWKVPTAHPVPTKTNPSMI